EDQLRHGISECFFRCRRAKCRRRLVWTPGCKRSLPLHRVYFGYRPVRRRQERTGLERHHQDGRAGECANGEQVLRSSSHKSARCAKSASRAAVSERAACRGKASGDYQVSTRVPQLRSTESARRNPSVAKRWVSTSELKSISRALEGMLSSWQRRAR